MGLAKPGETASLTGTGPGWAHQQSAGRVFGRVWNRTDPFLRSKPGPLVGYPDPLLTLVKEHLKVLSEHLRNTSFCLQSVWELLGASGRIGVAVQDG